MLQTLKLILSEAKRVKREIVSKTESAVSYCWAIAATADSLLQVSYLC